MKHDELQYEQHKAAKKANMPSTYHWLLSQDQTLLNFVNLSLG